MLPGAAEHQFKSTGQCGLPCDLQAGPAGGIIHNPAIDDRSFRANDQLGQVGNQASRPNTREPSRMHRCFSRTISPATSFAEWFERFVAFHIYRKRISDVRNRRNFSYNMIIIAMLQAIAA
jgi:hypothetical protein